MPALIEEEYNALLAGRDVPGGFPLNATSVGYQAARIVKAGAGRLYGGTVYSSNVAAQFIQFFDSATIPADGAAPVLVVSIAATSPIGLYFGSVGRWFYRGIVVCNSTTGPTKTLGAADTYFDIQFV